MFRPAFRLFGLRLVSSRCLCFWALAVNSLGGLTIFRMQGAYVDSSGTLIPALRVHLSPLDFSVVKCTLVLHSCISGRVIPLFKRRCSADDSSPLIGVVAGAKRGFVLVAFIPEISGRGYRFSTVALLRAR